MDTNQNFSFGNLDNVEERGSFEPIPVGMYRLRSVAQEMRDTKSGGGSYLAAEFEVVEGPFQGRKVFQNFNLVNRNEQAVEIALRDIKGWIVACGLPATGALTMDVINALEGKPFIAKVGIERDKSGQYEDKNKIAKFGDGQAAASQPSQGGAQEPQAPANAPAGRKPWET